MSREETSRIVPLAEIISRKGSPQKKIFKARCFSQSALIFKNLKTIFLLADGINFQKIELLEECSPVGAKWEEAQFVQLEFPDDVDVKVGDQVGINREDFPQLENEYYLCDLMNFEVFDEKGKLCGRVTGFFWQGPQGMESINLEVSLDEKIRQVPWTPEMNVSLSEKKITYPDFSLWEDL